MLSLEETLQNKGSVGQTTPDTADLCRPSRRLQNPFQSIPLFIPHT